MRVNPQIPLILLVVLMITIIVAPQQPGTYSSTDVTAATFPKLTGSDNNVYPNTWFSTIGSGGADYPWYGLFVDEKDNIYAFGQTTSWEPLGSQPVMLVKMSRFGENTRTVIVYGNKSFMGRDIIVLDDAIYGVGQLTGYGAGGLDGFIVKFHDDGSVEWFETLGTASSDLLWKITEGYNNTIYVTGYTYGFGAGKMDALVAKLDTSGRLLWDFAAGGSSYDFGWAIDTFYNESSGDEYVVVGGQSKSFDVGGLYDAMVFVVTGEGMPLWSLVFGTPSNDAVYGLVVDDEGYICTVGYTSNTTTGKNDFFVAKISLDGELLWVKAFGGDDVEIAHGVAVDDEYVYVAGLTNTFITGTFGEEDAFLVVMDKDTGDVARAVNIGGPDTEIAYSVAVKDEYVYLAGYTRSYGEGDKEFFVAKLNRDYILEDEPSELIWVYNDFPENVNVSVVVPTESNILLNSSTIYLEFNYTAVSVFTYDVPGMLVGPKTHIATTTGEPPAEITTTTVTETETETSTTTVTETVTSVSTTTATTTQTTTVTETSTTTVTETETSTVTSTKTETSIVTETVTSNVTFTTTKTETTVSPTTSIVTSPTTVTKTVTDYTVTGVVGVVLLLVGLGVGMLFTRRG